MLHYVIISRVMVCRITFCYNISYYCLSYWFDIYFFGQVGETSSLGGGSMVNRVTGQVMNGNANAGALDAFQQAG